MANYAIHHTLHFIALLLLWPLREVIPTVKHPASYSTQTFCASSESRFFNIVLAFWHEDKEWNGIEESWLAGLPHKSPIGQIYCGSVDWPDWQEIRIPPVSHPILDLELFPFWWLFIDWMIKNCHLFRTCMLRPLHCRNRKVLPIISMICIVTKSPLLQSISYQTASTIS